MGIKGSEGSVRFVESKLDCSGSRSAGVLAGSVHERPSQSFGIWRSDWLEIEFHVVISLGIKFDRPHDQALNSFAWTTWTLARILGETTRLELELVSISTSTRLNMARRRCPVCGSRQWRKEAASGLVTCSEGHVLQVQ